jgi:hypothetical protein
MVGTSAVTGGEHAELIELFVHDLQIGYRSCARKGR